MANIGSLIVDLALESAQFIAGLRNAQNQTNNAAAGISRAMGMIKGAAAGFLGALSVDAIMGQIQASYDYADAIVDLSDRTGMATATIQEFRYAAQMSGSSVESADAAVDKFAKTLGAAQNGNKALAKTFKELGVTSDDTTTAFRQALDGISKLGTATARNQKIQELFGKSAGDLTVLMSGGAAGFNLLAQAAEEYGIVLDDGLLRNAGQFNDKMDTMKMIVNAQMASMIISNADALMQLTNGFIQAAGAAAKFFSAMNVSRDMSLQSSNPMDWDLPSMAMGKLNGKSNNEIRDDARGRLKGTADGRRALYKRETERYNAMSPEERNSLPGQALRAEMEQLAKDHANANKGYTPPKPTGGTLPTGAGGAGKKKPAKHGPTLKTDEELAREWEAAYLRQRSSLYDSQANLTNDPTERAELEANSRRNEFFLNRDEIDADTGTEQEVREGKKRYTALQAEQLKQLEKEIFDNDYDRIMRDRDEELAKQRLDIASAGLQNESDILSAQMNLARSSKDRRDLALKMVDNQFEQERLQLEAIQASKDATAAEKAIAEARLKMLPGLKTLAQEGARKQNQSPLEAYLDAIPQTKKEINDALESVEVEGLKSLEDGLMGVIDGTKSVGEAFSDMTKTILSGLMKIALQQMIIKPLGAALFGGDDSGGGGLFGSIFKGITGALTGKRANGGYTGKGDYLVGERGPEVVRIGANANVVPTRSLRNFANDNSSGLTINFGGIVSNDPDAIKRAAMEGVAQAMPLIAQQASDKTLARLQRRQL